MTFIWATFSALTYPELVEGFPPDFTSGFTQVGLQNFASYQVITKK